LGSKPQPMKIAAWRCWSVAVARLLGNLLTRLDRAIDKAINEDIFTDEINPPPNAHP
jgi:hypothetical protein